MRLTAAVIFVCAVTLVLISCGSEKAEDEEREIGIPTSGEKKEAGGPGQIEPSALQPAQQKPELLGPTPYLSRDDSPFIASILAGDTILEDFEDGLLDTGVTADSGIVTSTRFSGSIIDSVDGDDGDATNGTCAGCDSYFGRGLPGITFTFDATVSGGLPTHAGVVWTDGAGTTNFEAFDETGASLGIVGPVQIADGTFHGTTGEDRFFGAINPGGISAIHVSNTSGGIEADHLQYGRGGGSPARDAQPVAPQPEPEVVNFTTFNLNLFNDRDSLTYETCCGFGGVGCRGILEIWIESKERLTKGFLGSNRPKYVIYEILRAH